MSKSYTGWVLAVLVALVAADVAAEVAITGDPRCAVVKCVVVK
jgi:hypothetical protein